MLKFLSSPFWGLLLLLVGISWNAPAVQAQAITFSYIFDGQVLTGTSSQPGATANNATYGAGLGIKTFYAGNPGDAIAGDGFASGTPLNIANNDYFGFSFTVAACSTVTLTNVSFDARRSGTGPANQEIRYSTNGFATSLLATTLSGTNYESKSGTLPNLVLNGGQTVEFRLYGFNASGGTGTLRVDNVRFTGTIANSAPSAFAVTGGGEVCPPAGAPVGLTGSQLNVNYQLRLNGSPLGAPVPGNGGVLTFGDQTDFGTYTVVATNASGCSVAQTGSVVISQSSNCGGGGCSVSLSTTQVNVLCNGNSTGSIDLTPSGGTPSYTYAWSSGATSQDVSNLAAGTYMVTVTDAGGCSQTTSVTLTQPTALVLTNTQTNVLCNGNSTGSIDLTVSGGTPAYTYSWTGGVTTQDRTNLAAGTYTVTVTDANGCSKTNSVTITQPSVLSLSTTQNNVLCNTAGSIDLMVSGGTPAYTYSWSNGPTTQDVSNLAAGTYTVTVTDANNCTKTTSVTITQASALSLSSTVVNPSNCFVSDGSIDLSVSGGQPGYSYDWSNDGDESPDNDPQDLQNLPEGTYTITVTDASGCTATHTEVLDYIDVIRPAITCPENIAIPAGADCSSAVGDYSPATLSDNCSANPSVVQSPASGTVLNSSNPTRVVTLTATDEAGNSQTCNFTVSLVDLSAPSVVCPADQIVNADANCTGTVGAWSPVASNDNCGGSPAVEQSPEATTELNGHNDARMVTLTATDNAGNTQTCTFTVTLKDVSNPSISCPADVMINADENCSGLIGDYLPTALSDNCTANPSVVQSPDASYELNGHNTSSIVTLTATDDAGNTQTCALTVTLIDVTPPTIICKPFVAELDADGMVSISISDVYESGSDNCGEVIVYSVYPNTFNCSNIGDNLVSLATSDNHRNRTLCTTTVTVKDAIAPVAACKDITVNLGLNGSVNVNPSAIDNGTTDNCSFTLSLEPGLFECANIGLNIVTLVATDAGGNTATCTATVEVNDLSAPSAKCKNPTIYLNEAGQVTLTAAEVNNGSSDACGIATMSIDVTEFNCSNLPGSSWPVILSLVDVHGNASTCLSNVVVKDAIAPTAICQNVTVAIGSDGRATVYGEDLAFNSFDNCSVWSFSPIAKVYTTANLGANNLTVTVKDWSGNASTCVSVVTVVIPDNGNFQQGGKGKGVKAGNLDFAVYPNPTQGSATLAFQLPAEQTFVLRIFDTAGRMVYNQKGLGMEGENILPLRLEGIASGVYLIDLQSDNWMVQKRLMVQE